MVSVSIPILSILLLYFNIFTFIFAPLKVCLFNSFIVAYLAWLMIYHARPLLRQVTEHSDNDELNPLIAENSTVAAIYIAVDICRPLLTKMFSIAPELVEMSNRLDDRLTRFGFKPLNLASSKQVSFLSGSCTIRYHLLPDQGSNFCPANPNIRNDEIEIFSPSELTIKNNETVECRSGLILVIPSNHYGKLHSAIPGVDLMKERHDCDLKNAELIFKLRNKNLEPITIKKGDKIGSVSIEENKKVIIAPAF